MKISLSDNFFLELGEIVAYIAKDKPIVAKNFKKDLILSIRKDLKNPYNFKKSIYFKDEIYRDYVFKGYAVLFKINDLEEFVSVFGIIKNKNSY